MGRRGRPLGGILGLVALLREHCEAVEYDLLQLGLDLRDLWRPGGLSWRRLGVVIDHLPPESATKTAIRETLTPEQLADIPEATTYGPWSRAEMLAARIGDGIDQLIWMQTTGESPPPPPLPRPGIERPMDTNSGASLSFAKAYLEEVLRNHGALPSPDWQPNLDERG
jgi:hypothetical protein